jgi:hypothetical protein
MAQKLLSEFLLTVSGIQHRVPRRTISRIRLSDQRSCVRTREVTARAAFEFQQPVGAAQVWF